MSVTVIEEDFLLRKLAPSTVVVLAQSALESPEVRSTNDEAYANQ
jgi:hypothetical protein